MVRAVTKGTGADRLAVLEQAVQLTQGCNERGSPAQAAARQLCLGALAVAAAGVLRHADPLRQEELEVGGHPRLVQGLWSINMPLLACPSCTRRLRLCSTLPAATHLPTSLCNQPLPTLPLPAGHLAADR